jgi:hypothetical protein
VLSRGEDSRVREAVRGGQRQAGHAIGIAAERSIADDGVVGVGVDVQDRREIPGESGGVQLATDGTGHVAGQRRIIDAPQGGRGRGIQKGLGKPDDTAALLIHADQERLTCGGAESR